MFFYMGVELVCFYWGLLCDVVKIFNDRFDFVCGDGFVFVSVLFEKGCDLEVNWFLWWDLFECNVWVSFFYVFVVG